MMMDQRTMKATKAPKPTRSENAPVMSSGVMTENIIWKDAKTVSGIVPDTACVAVPPFSTVLLPMFSPSTSMKNVWLRSPMMPPASGPSASV